MKTRRQTKILELIKKYEIETQEDLSAYLEEEGYQVTQATVSRDIRELKLTKVSLTNGKQKYVALLETNSICVFFQLCIVVHMVVVSLHAGRFVYWCKSNSHMRKLYSQRFFLPVCIYERALIAHSLVVMRRSSYGIYVGPCESFCFTVRR